MIPESDTPSMDIENVDMNYKANVHEYSQRVIYNVHNFCFLVLFRAMPVAPEYNNHYFENNI